MVGGNLKELKELIRSFGAAPNSPMEKKIIEYVKNNFKKK
jgi:hypothetical protein